MKRKGSEFEGRSKSGLSSASKGDDSRGDGGPILTVAEIEGLQDNLKQPPAIMQWQDFKEQYGLEEDGMNPHRLRKGRDVSEELMIQFFGKGQGTGGRSGYAWADCKDPQVISRIKYLHPLLYQTSDSEIPRVISCQFARGIVFEYSKKEKVNWCKFGEETNLHQRVRYAQDKGKLEYAIQQGLEVTKSSWRKIKVPVQTVKMEMKAEIGEGSSRGQSDVGTPRSAQPRHFNPGSAFHREVGIPPSQWSPPTLDYMENLFCILNMEIEALKTNFNTAVTKKDEVGGQVRVLELVCDSFGAKVQSLIKNDLEIQKTDPLDIVSLKSNEAKKAWMVEVMEEKQQELNTMRVQASKMEHEAEECERVLRLKKIMLDGVKAECELLKTGRISSGFHPTPIVYPSSKVDEDDLGLGMFLKITAHTHT